MRIPFLSLAALALLLVARADEAADAAFLRRLYDAALAGTPAYSRLGELVGNYPGRITGSPHLDGAEQWGKRVLTELGVDRVELQPVKVPHWERGEPGSVRIVGPDKRGEALAAVALGSSGATPPEGLRAPVVELRALSELETADVKGKIVFFNRPMRPEDLHPGVAYSGAGDQRNKGPGEAARRGAVAVLTRSLTHAHDDVPHTGIAFYPADVPRIPASALSTVAADRLSAALAANPALQVEIVSHARMLPEATNHNVIGEIRGTEFPGLILLVGGHLDSWDITPGAHDDGAGIVQALEVIRLLKAVGYRPRHTVRCVLFTAEENSGAGGKEYARLAAEKKEKHLLAFESDGGGDQPRHLEVGNAAGTARAKAERWLPLLALYDIFRLTDGKGGSDVGPLFAQGGVVGQIVPYSQRYFDVHHTAVDTLDKVNPRELQLGAAAMAAMVYLYDQE